MFFFSKNNKKVAEEKTGEQELSLNRKEFKKDILINEYIKKLGDKKSEYTALYLYTSKLSESNQKSIQRQKLIETFEMVTHKYRGEIFGLPSDDMVVIYDKKAQEEILACLIKIRYIFHDDAFFKGSYDLEQIGFVKYYELDDEFKNAIQESIKNYEEQNTLSKKSNGSFDSKWQPIQPKIRKLRRVLTPTLLGKVQKALSMTDFSSLIRRQSVCAVIGKSMPQVLFDEVYVSIADLRDMLLPDVDLTANPWLFQDLASTLDKRVLDHVAQHDDGALINNFSLNLNVSSILSDEFLAFDDSNNTYMRNSIVLEVQLVDIFNDIKAYMLAKTFAQYRGYKICIDGVTVDKLKYVNRTNLGADLIKIIWHSSFMDVINEDKHFMDYVNRAERAKMILCRVDDPTAVEVGNSLGINLYQGRYIQKLLSSTPEKTIYKLR